ncbi:MAG: hypothetical protein QOF61_971, partial [Acidobacteriota bacterium]|nr:hypothetical protein [Acidobacteriota bacterium]
ASRGDNGAISFRDWRTVGLEEYGYAAPDPLNPNLIYGGKLSRIDKTTGQEQQIAPEAVRSGKYRFLRTAPVIFSPVDPHALYYAGTVLFKTTDGGMSWSIISPDLSREKTEVPESIGVYRTPDLAQMARRGVIYTVAPSYKDANTIWAGTDDGLIHVTRDGGKSWQNVTPPALTAWSKVSIIDAGRFDAGTAYAAINRFRLDDLRPHIYRTHDGGKTWKEIVKGLPNDPVNVVREDPQRKGLLFAGTERAVYVSFNDGDEWQPLRLNMPASSVRDLVVHDDDVVVGTHGRSFWILDDITPLRQIDAEVAASQTFLFQPETTYRYQRNVNTDTPLPPEEPVGKNPPDGAIIDYYLKRESGAVTLEIYDQSNQLVRRFSSEDKPEAINEKDYNVPTYWFRPPQILSKQAGMQRFVWDLRYPPPKAQRYDYPISANYRDTPRTPLGVAVAPGLYTLKLTAGGRTLTRTLNLKIDPRVKTAPAGLRQQFELSLQAYEGMNKSFDALADVKKLRARIKEVQERAGAGATADALAALDQKLATIGEGGGGGGRGTGGASRGETNLAQINSSFESLLDLLQSADAQPTTQSVAASAELQRQLADLLSRWNAVKTGDVRALDEQLRRANLPTLSSSL